MQFNIGPLTAPIVFAIFAVLLLFAAIAIAIREKKSTVTKQREADFIDRFAEKKKKQLASIPGAISFKVYAIILFVAPVILAVVSWLLLGFGLNVILGAALGFLMPEVVLRAIKADSDKKFDEKFGRALRQMASTLRAGMTIQQAVQDVCATPFLDKSIKEMFMQIDSDIKVGFPVEAAFKKMSDMYPTHDTIDVAAAIAMQTQVGGNEAEVVDAVAKNINNRIMTRKEVNAMFATANMTVLVMDIAPPLVSVFMIASGGGMISDYYFSSPTNTLLLIAIFGVMGIGSLVSHGMVNKAKEGIV